jgi:hypothetical protein
MAYWGRHWLIRPILQRLIIIKMKRAWGHILELMRFIKKWLLRVPAKEKDLSGDNEPNDILRIPPTADRPQALIKIMQ